MVIHHISVENAIKNGLVKIWYGVKDDLEQLRENGVDTIL
jgi:hypothetical protein